MIIDAHMHSFPCLKNGYGPRDRQTHFLYLQKFVSVAPAQDIRRLKDNFVVKDKEKWALWDENDPSPRGAYNVNFRVVNYGRLIWTKDGVDYYLQLYAPSLQQMKASPEFLLAQMNYIGVKKGILQNAWLYGQLNDYFGEMVKKYPDRFIGTVQVNEAFANQEDQIEELCRGVQDLGLKALYYANVRLFEMGFKVPLDDEIFHPFWNKVRELDIPVFWDITAIREHGDTSCTPYERFLIQMRRFKNWRKNFPEINCILVHGVPLRYIRKGDNFVTITDEIWKIWQKPNVFLELLFPMQVSHPIPGGNIWDYPYKEVHTVIKNLYAKLGPEKLVWGSDMPNTERNCTYKQSFQYLDKHCPFLSKEDKKLLFSSNITRIFKLKSE